MKAMFTILGLVVLAGAGVYYFGVSGYDPDAAGAAARAAITPGMTWEQVVDTTKEPKKYRKYVRKEIDGVEVVDLGGQNVFERKSFAQRVADGKLPDGFVFEYLYTAKTAFQVDFDGDGKATGTSDIPTMADLLQTR